MLSVPRGSHSRGLLAHTLSVFHAVFSGKIALNDSKAAVSARLKGTNQPNAWLILYKPSDQAGMCRLSP